MKRNITTSINNDVWCASKQVNQSVGDTVYEELDLPWTFYAIVLRSEVFAIVRGKYK